MISETKVEAALGVLADPEWKAAKARAAHEYLAEMKKVVLARLKDECNEKTAAAREDYALNHPKYEAHLEQLKLAAEADYELRDKKAGAEAIIDMWRTEQSNARSHGRIG